MNAAVNIAARAVPRVAKARVTRAKNRKLQPQQPLKTPVARNSLKYPGRDRTKNAPTPKRKNNRRTVREVILPLRPARAQAPYLDARVLADWMHVATWGPMWRRSNKETRPTKVGYVSLFNTVLACLCRARLSSVGEHCCGGLWCVRFWRPARRRVIVGVVNVREADAAPTRVLQRIVLFSSWEVVS